jgi:formylglycine-generating enzyme required for sulfatase activity
MKKEKSSGKKQDPILIPQGPALIGADDPGEGPPILLEIPAFWMHRHAVTNQEFRAFLQDGGYRRPEFWDVEALNWLKSDNVTEPAFWSSDLFNQPDQPVTGVSFYEAQAYARWAEARLPTEIEWEKAARGARGARHPWGDEEPDSNRANFAPNFVPLNITPVPVQDCASGDSPYGCRQMAGNVYEWCLDYFHYDTPAHRSPKMLCEYRPSHRRVLKGGSWGSGASRLRTAARWSGPAQLRDNIVGFRLARDKNGFTTEQEEKL